MSADLLRRAAAKLRQRAADVPPTWPAPWFPVITDSESVTGVAACADHEEDPAEGPYWACDSCEHFETYGEGLAAYVSAMHPPVALALADWLADLAELQDIAEWNRDEVPGGTAHPLAVARAVLREPADGER